VIWFFLLAGAAAAPFAFQHLWAQRWFKILWWIVVLYAVGSILQIEDFLHR
jgi:hypothetical protein